jgi:hypothetical protein
VFERTAAKISGKQLSAKERVNFVLRDLWYPGCFESRQVVGSTDSKVKAEISTERN